MIFHPRHWVRKVCLWIGTSAFRVQCRLHHIHCEIGSDSRIRHCRVRSKIDGTLIIGAGCTLQGAYFGFYGSGGKIEIGNHVFVNAYLDRPTSFFVKDCSSIFIENKCLFSNSIDISTTDWHSIYDDKGNHLNPDKDIHIGQRVWVGRKVTICKGVSIPNNSVIGVGSVVTKSFSETNIVIAGNPAVIKRQGIHW